MQTDQLGAFCAHASVYIKGAHREALSGLTFGAKDLFDVAGHVTGCGNPDWLATHLPAQRTAPTITALVEHGATLLGKTLSDELAYSLNGENVHYGTPINPKAPGRIPGGSSSGSVAAVAGNLVDFALGTDTGGSVRVPASYCGVYGFRPTHGRITLECVMPLAPSFDTVGWFARSPRVLEKVARVLFANSYRKGRRPLALVLAKDCFAMLGEPERQILLDTAAALASDLELPAETLTVSEEGLEHWMAAFRRLQGREIWAIHGEWIRTTNPRFGAGIRKRFEMAAHLGDDSKAEDEALQQRVAERMAKLLSGGRWLCLPTTVGVAPLHGLPEARLNSVRNRVLCLTCIAGLARLPQINLPLAKQDELPLGLSLVAAPNGDEGLLQAVLAVDVASESVEIGSGGE